MFLVIVTVYISYDEKDLYWISQRSSLCTIDQYNICKVPLEILEKNFQARARYYSWQNYDHYYMKENIYQFIICSLVIFILFFLHNKINFY